jgi:hypothetical protein
MKTLIAICILSTLAFAQTKAPAVTVTYSITGSFTAPVAAFSLLGTCQPGPLPAVPACALPTPSLGVPYSVTLPTSGINAPVTCTVSSGALPSWASLTVSGTSCVVSGTPKTADPMNFSLTASGQ